MMFRRGHKPDVAALSALADGALPPAEARALDAHVATCEACSTQLDGMRQVRSLLAAMPRAEAPRSFRLRQADVETAVPQRARPSVAPRLLPALSALGMIVFAVALGADITSNGGGSRVSNDSVTSLQAENAGAYLPDAQDLDARAGEPALGMAPPTGEPAADSATGAADDEGTAGNDAATAADGATKQAEDAKAAIIAATADTAAREELEATAAQDTGTDDGDGPGALLVIEIAALAVALGAGAVAVSMWARRRTTT